MFSGLVRHIKLTAKAKTGLSGAVVAFAIIAAICAAVAFVLLIVVGFIWLEERYGALTASLVLFGFFLMLAILAALACLITHKRVAEQARLALQARSQWTDPSTLAVGLQLGRAIGLRRIVPLIAVGFLAMTLSREWFGNRVAEGDDDAAADES
ncbi:MAG: hypothetical protein ACRECO_22640 [Xanthobacteraceae bacterium]